MEIKTVKTSFFSIAPPYDVVNLLSIGSAANLIAGILFIVVAIKLGHST